MSYSIMLIHSLFQDEDDHDNNNISCLSDSEPKTPAFKDEKEQLIRQINQVMQQNQILQNECQKQMMNLSQKLAHSQIKQSEIGLYKEKIKYELNQNQFLVNKFLQKHESCFHLKQTLIQQKKHSKLKFQDLGKRITTCPSETSTVPSPLLLIPSSPQLKKLHYNSFNHHF